jgi:hypothetical protein
MTTLPFTFRATRNSTLPTRAAHSAFVYIDGTAVVAEDEDGVVIASGVPDRHQARNRAIRFIDRFPSAG